MSREETLPDSRQTARKSSPRGSDSDQPASRPPGERERHRRRACATLRGGERRRAALDQMRGRRRGGMGGDRPRGVAGPQRRRGVHHHRRFATPGGDVLHLLPARLRGGRASLGDHGDRRLSCAAATARCSKWPPAGSPAPARSPRSSPGPSARRRRVFDPVYPAPPLHGGINSGARFRKIGETAPASAGYHRRP